MNTDRNIEYWYICREAQLLGQLGVDIAERLESAVLGGRAVEAAELIRAVVRVSARLSHILWPTGSWATSPDGRRVAAALRDKLGVTEGDPLSPARIVSFTAVAPMSSSELRQAIDLDRRMLCLEHQEYPIDGLIGSLREIHRASQGMQSVVDAA